MAPTFTFYRSLEWDRIHRIMTHPRVWPWISDDLSGPPEKFVVQHGETLCYVIVEEPALTLGDATRTMGLFLLEQHNGVHLEVHTCLLPAAWLRDSRAIATQAMAWMWANIPQVERLTTTVPQNNSLALRFAQALGMVEYGMNPASFLKGGKLMNQTLLGMNRPEGTR